MSLTRPATTLSAVEADLGGAAIDAFTTALGGRDALGEALAVATRVPEIDRVLRLLEDPRYAGWSLRKICELANLSVADLFSAYKKALVVRAHLEATRVVTENLVGVVADVMRRAQPQAKICPTCRGLLTYTPAPTKKIPTPEPRDCGTCQDAEGRPTGAIVVEPDLDRQKVALELGQLLQTRAGISIQQNTLALPGGGGTADPARVAVGPIDALQQAVQAILVPRVTPARPAAAPPAPVVEGEVVAREGTDGD